MNKTGFTFEWLLHPCNTKAFMKKYWGKKPLLIHRNRVESYYSSLLSLADVDRIVTTINHKPLSIVKDGAIIPPVFHSNGEDKEKVIEFYNEGGTIILDRVESSSHQLLELCNQVRGFFQVSNKVFCNVYITPPGKRAFDLHSDDQDVFIIQVEGSKNWKVYQPEFELPINEQQTHIPEGFEERVKPVLDITLQKGDFLYVPRGFPHKVSTTDQHSIHITLTVINYTWYDFFYQVLGSTSDTNVELRRSLPRDFFERMQPNSGKKDFLHAWNVTSLKQASNALKRSAMKSIKPQFKGSVGDSLNLENIAINSTVARRGGLTVDVKGGKKKTTIVTNVGQFSMEGLHRQILFITSRDVFKVSEIPGRLTADEKIELATAFVRSGLLRIED